MLRVFEDDLQLPDGSHLKNFLRVAPQGERPNFVTGVAVLPVYDNGAMGLILNNRHLIESDIWEVPRGFIDEGETPVEAALRELEEETGLVCGPGDIHSLGLIAPEPGILASRNHLFFAINCVNKRPFIPNELGHLDFRSFDRVEIDRMILKSEIEDPCTIAAYHKYVHSHAGVGEK